MPSRPFTPAVALLLTFTLSAPLSAQNPAHRAEILAPGLDRPWALELLPGGGDILITGRSGRIWLFGDDGLREIAGAPEVDDRGQGGLLDIAAAPDFAQSGMVWLTWSGVEAGGRATTRLGRARLDAAAERLGPVETLFSVSPPMNSPAHFGSRIVFDGDYVFVGFGDRSQKDFGPDHVAQRLDSENGSVIRLTLEGEVPGDNPFIGQSGAQAAIWSYGHRNIQAMALAPDGTLWAAEHGENGGDEINRIEAGGNYGWPLAAFGVDYRSGAPFAPPHKPGDGFIAPAWHSPPGREAPYPPSGMAFYEGAAFPGLEGRMLLGNLGGQYLGIFTLEGEPGRELPRLSGRLLEEQGWRIRDVAVDGDGIIYALTDGDDGALVRILPD